jgi:hypothetical protein
MQLTVDDPKVYTKPWVGQLKRFRLIEHPKTVDNWSALYEDICAPADEVDQFAKRIRDPAGGRAGQPK